MLAATVGLAGVVIVTTQAAWADLTTISVDSTRQAWRQDESALPPSSVPAHEQFTTPVSGAVYGQPLVVGSTVIVATENDMVYGIDRNSGSINWSTNVGTAEPTSVLGCDNLGPSSGATSTPVLDPATGLVYLTAHTWDGSTATSAQWFMYALSASSGAVQPGWPVLIGGSASNDPTTAFDAPLELQRPGLLLLGDRVYAAFGANCDLGDYRGWVVGVSTSTRAQTRWVDEANPNGGESNIGGGIWQSGGGLSSDGPNQILLAVGNGTPPPSGPASVPSNAFGESVVRLQAAADGTLTPTDRFTPSNADQLNKNDADLGSAGPVVLPDGFGGVPNHPHLVFQAGKTENFLLDRDSLGGMAQGPGGSDAALAEIPAINNAGYSHPGVWGGDGGYVYTTEETLRAFHVVVDGSGNATLSATNSGSLGFESGSPVVTSSGSTSGSALVWVVDRTSDTAGELQAYNPVPVNGQLQLLWQTAIGAVPKFAVPATDGNEVFVGTQDGHLLAFLPGPPTCQTYSSPSTGSHQVCGSILAKYQALGGPSSFLGYPTTDETGTPDGIGRFNHFSSSASSSNVDGSIYWTPNTGAWSIHGGIRAKWASLGWERSFLGYPTTDETGVSDGVGRFNHFSNSGSIYWTPSTGALSIHGGIRDKFLALGGPTSFLGYPVTDETGTPDGIGRFNHFSGGSGGSGSIYWTPSTGAWSVHGGIRAKWASMGWERSCLGYPVSDEFGDSSTRQSNFQGGSITYSFTTGQASSSC